MENLLIGDLVYEKQIPEIKGEVTAIFKNYEEYCNTDVCMTEKSKKSLNYLENPYTEEELSEIFYSVFWGKENGQSLHPESHLFLQETTMENQLMFQARREDTGEWIIGYFTRKKKENLIYPVIEVEKEKDSGDYIESHIIDGETLKKASIKNEILEMYYVLFQKSMLYDEDNNECLTYYVEDGVFSNGIKNAKFFKGEDETKKVLKEFEEVTKIHGYPKTHIQKIAVSV